MEPIPISFKSVAKVVRRKNKQTIIKKPLVSYKVPVKKLLKHYSKTKNLKQNIIKVNYMCVYLVHIEMFASVESMKIQP